MKKFLIVLFALWTALASAGVMYTSRVTIEMYNQTPEAKEQMEAYGGLTGPQEMKAFVDGNGARIKFLTDHMLYQKDDFAVTEDGVVMYLCSPATKTYHRFDSAAMMKQAQGMLDTMQKMTKMSYSNIFVNVTDQGDGGSVAGYATTRYRVLIEYDVNMKILFKKINQHHKEEVFVYATSKLPFGYLPKFHNQQMFGTGIEEIDGQIGNKLDAIGFPLKTEHMSYGENNELTSKATFEITEITEKDLNPQLFKVPDGYTEKEMEVETQGEDGETQKKKFKLGDMFK